MIYAMSDIHGCMNEFEKMLEKIHFSNHDMLYIIGDVVDRGPEPIKILQFIMKTKNIHLLKGNHEEMMLNCLVSPYLSKEKQEDVNYQLNLQTNRSLWIGYNGGETTAAGYNRLNFEEQIDIYNYLSELNIVQFPKVGKRQFCLLHGAPDKMFHAGSKTGIYSVDILWSRIEETELSEDLVPGFELISGHTPTVYYGQEYASKVIKGNHKYLIDCGCVFGYALGCICLNTGEISYVKKNV